MNYRCINNPGGYCHSKPQVSYETPVYHYPDSEGNPTCSLYKTATCVNNWQTCTQFVTWTQECQRMGLLTPAG